MRWLGVGLRLLAPDPLARWLLLVAVAAFGAAVVAAISAGAVADGDPTFTQGEQPTKAEARLDRLTGTLFRACEWLFAAWFAYLYVYWHEELVSHPGPGM